VDPYELASRSFAHPGRIRRQAPGHDDGARPLRRRQDHGHPRPGPPRRTSIEVTIQTASIRTHNEQRDNDLRSSNFLEVDKYPTITFKSTNIEHVGGDRYTMAGDLTIKGNTRPVTLNMVRYGEFNDPMMGHRVSYGAEAKISRKDFGLNFKVMLDGKFVVSAEVQILIEGELVEQKQGQVAGA
jgi:polyisoprenoid-binding protein YceI